MKKDDELDQIRVRLLPEGFLATAKQVVQKGCDAEGQRVGVQVVVEGVVAVFGIEADFDVILAPFVAVEDALHLAAKVTFDFEDQAADSLLFLGCFVGQNLLGKWVHAAACFAGSHGTENRNPGEQSALGNSEPSRGRGGSRFASVVDLADHEIKVVPLAWVGIARETARQDAPTDFQREDVEARKQGRKDHEGRCEKDGVVEVPEAQESIRSAHGNHTQEDLVCGKRVRVIEEDSRAHRQQGRDEAARVENPLDHALILVSTACVFSEGDRSLRRCSLHFR